MKVWEGNWKGWINRQSKKISGHQLEFWVSTKPRLIIAVCCLGSDFKSHPEKKRCDWSMCNALVTIRNGCGGDAGDNKMMWNCRCLLLPPPWKQPWQLQIKLYKKKKSMPIFNVSSEINCTTEFVLGMAFVFRTVTELWRSQRFF